MNTATLRNAGGPGSVLVDVELSDPSGPKVGQRFWDDQSFAADESRSFTYQHTFAAGASGVHAVHVWLFEPQWEQLLSWHADVVDLRQS